MNDTLLDNFKEIIFFETYVPVLWRVQQLPYGVLGPEVSLAFEANKIQ